MKSSSGFLAATVLLCLGIAQHAAADPIVITGGSMLVTGQNELGSIALTGTRGFSLRGGVDPSEGAVDAMNLCSTEEPRCAGGSTISVGTFLTGFAFPSGIVTLDGVTYDDLNDFNSPSSIVVQLTGTIALPPIQAAPLIVTAPFGIGALSEFFPDSSVVPGVPIRGSEGRATLSLIPGRDGGGTPPPWVLDQIRYDFNDAAPIPEPGMMLLVAAGVAGAWRCRRR
jgi:hypothetical protein